MNSIKFSTQTQLNMNSAKDYWSLSVLLEVLDFGNSVWNFSTQSSERKVFFSFFFWYEGFPRGSWDTNSPSVSELNYFVSELFHVPICSAIFD